LEHRVRRLELAIAALRDRAVFRESTVDAAPPALRQAIASFELEIVALRHRLSELDHWNTVAEPRAGERLN
jgi:hypothetical protein